jgi:hypothetical protein
MIGYTSLVFLVFPIIGIVFIILGIKGLIRYKELPKVDAEIIDYNIRRGDTGRIYAAVYSYTFNGQFIENASSNLYTSLRPRIGSIKEIAVDPEYPKKPITRGSSILLLSIGIMFTIISSFIVPAVFMIEFM